MKWLWEGGIKRGQKGLASLVHVLDVIKVGTRIYVYKCRYNSYRGPN